MVQKGCCSSSRHISVPGYRKGEASGERWLTFKVGGSWKVPADASVYISLSGAFAVREVGEESS